MRNNNNFIAGKKLGITAGDNKIASAGDRNNNAFLRKVQLHKALAVKRIVVRQLKLIAGGLPPVEGD